MTADEKLMAAARGAFQTPCDAVLQLIPDGGAPVFVDARRDPPEVLGAPPKDKAEPDCVWRAPADILARVLASKRAVESAVINGRLVIAGDMSVMARLRLVGKA